MEWVGLTAVVVGTVLIATSSQEPPTPVVRKLPVQTPGLTKTPPPRAVTEWPPDPVRMRLGRWAVLAGLAALLTGLLVRWV